METSRSHPSESLPQVPGYELLEKIGEGGMGEVYRATQLSLQRAVAIKFLDPAAGGAAGTSIFQRESHLLASLAHPNVVTIHDCGQAEGRNYLVMEHVKGASLRSQMQRGRPWTAAAAAGVLDAIARALSYIHEQGILHLDLKPENVLCTDEGQIKISDFGLAVSRQEAQVLAEGQLYLGTIDYCAPEQRFGLELDPRCDVFSLATLAYELLTGRLPGRVYVPASRRNRRLPRALDDVLCRGLARIPQERYESVAEFHGALARALRQPAPRRKSVLWLLLAAVALLAMVAGAWNWWPRTSLPSSPDTGTVSSSVPTRGWLLHDRPDSLALLVGAGREALKGGPGVKVEELKVTGARPELRTELPFPSWPTPLPVLVLSSPGTWGFVHPFLDSSLGQRLLTHWPRLLELPPRSVQDNRVQCGNFDGQCFHAPGAEGESGPWLRAVPNPGKNPQPITTAIPPDRPGNPALLIDRPEGTPADAQVFCYQFYLYAKRPPEPDGTTMVLRYRARAERGEPRLVVAPHYPWSTPKGDNSSPVSALRKRSVTNAAVPSTAETDNLLYSLQDWVLPTREWQTYYVIWESPPVNNAAPGKEKAGMLIIISSGPGKLWVDDVELFAWEPGRQP